MKIKTSKIVALLLAFVLVFGSAAVVSSAVNADPCIKVSSISNAAVGSKGQKLEVSLSSDTTLTASTVELGIPAGKLENISVSELPAGVNGSVKYDAANSKIVFSFTADVVNNTAADMLLSTITFDFAKDTKGLVEIVPAVSGEGAKIGNMDMGVSRIKGEAAADVYTDMCGIAVKGAVKSAGSDGKIKDVNVVVSFEMMDSTKPVTELTIPVDSAAHGLAVMTTDGVKKFVEANAAKITEAVKAVAGYEDITYDDFDFVADSIKLNDAKINAGDKYDKTKAPYTYTVTLKQLPVAGAKFIVVFRPALEDQTLYHSSDIDNLEIKFDVNVGKTIYAQATVLKLFKEYVEVYNSLGGSLDIEANGIELNSHIKAQSEGKYDLGDFTLNEEVVLFNGAKIQGTEKFSENADENVYTVFFDQVNVPATVLGTAAEAFGKLNYAEFAKANVKLINETIGAFQAFCDSLVNAEWPSAEDVEDGKDSSGSPNTGSAVGLGSALAVVLALTATAAVIIKKKED